MDLKYLSNLCINKNDSSIEFSFELSKDIPFFDGHFPSRPILPAIAYLEICLKLYSEVAEPINVYSIKKSKFLKPLSPEEKIQVLFKRKKDNHLLFDWFSNDQLVATINILTKAH